MPTLVQSKSNAAVGDQVSVVLDVAPVDGNLLVAYVASKTDGHSLDPVVAGFSHVVTGNSGFVAPSFHVKKAGAAESATVTATIDASSRLVLIVAEYSGGWPADPAAAAVSSFGGQQTGTTVPAGSLAVDGTWLLLTGLNTETEAGSPSMTVDSSFAVRQDAETGTANFDRRGVYADRVVTGNLTVSPVWTRGSTTGVAQAGMFAVQSDPAEEVLPAPSNVALTATTDVRELTASWDAVTGADSYQWEMEEQVGGAWGPFLDGSAAVSPVVVDDTDGVWWNTTYRVRVRGVSE